MLRLCGQRWSESLVVFAVVLMCSLAPGHIVAEDSSKHIPGLDVTKATINTTLAAMPGDARVLMEFYATWCPACRAFKPEYDKVARFLQTLPAGPGKVVALRLDCAIDPDVCGTYQVASYPSMYAATAADLLTVKVDRFTKFDYGKYSRNAAGVVKFISDAFKTELIFVEVKEVQKPIPEGAKGETKIIAVDLQWTNPDVQLATTQLFDSITAQELLHNSAAKRQALVDLLTVWSVTHPVPSCKAGSVEVLQKLTTMWPEGKDNPVSPLEVLSVCGDCKGDSGLCSPTVAADGTISRPKPVWVACRGSKPEQRGFTCALWLLFHTTAARLSDGEGVQLFMKSLRGFAFEFFQCAVCKKHFERITDSAAASAVRSQRDAVLWVWKAHNEVNERLAVIEKKYGHSSTGDAAYPKVSWPSKSVCPQCWLPVLQKKSDERGGSDGGRRTGESQSYGEDAVRWNEEEVYRFLMKWYGGEPGDGNAESVGGSDMLLDGQSDDEERMLDDENVAGVGLLSNNMTTTFIGVAIVAVMLLLLYRRQQQRRRTVYGGLKGPGAVGHKGHVVNGSKYTVRLDAEALSGSRYPGSFNRKGFQ